MTPRHHLDPATVLSHAAGALSQELSAVVATHLEGCATCREAVARAEGVGGLLINQQHAQRLLSGVDTDQLRTDVVDALTAYVNTLGVGADIIYNELVAAIMGVFGVTDVDITTPTANVTIAATQVGRLGTITLFGV